MKLTTNALEIAVNTAYTDVLYWQTKFNNAKHRERRNYYRQKVELAEYDLKQAKQQLHKNQQTTQP